jgi:hypothetical protein
MTELTLVRRLAIITFALVVILFIAVFSLTLDVVDLRKAHASTLVEQLTAEVQAHGTKAGMDLLEKLTNENPDANRDQHALVHELGKASYAYHNGDVQKALAECDTRFWSGCYHGTLQAYFGALSDVTSSHMNSLCPAPEKGARDNFLRYNCLHGAGHGLAIKFDYDIAKSLAHCDLLKGPNWDRESCYGGVFMENIVSFQQHHHDGKGGFITKDDLHYPCSVVTAKYGNSCWQIQTSAILTLADYRWETAFAECDKANDFRETCLESVGRDISGFSQRKHEGIAKLCALGAEAQQWPCQRGAIKDMVFHVAQAEPGYRFCNQYATKPNECAAIVQQAEKHLGGK